MHSRKAGSTKGMFIVFKAEHRYQRQLIGKGSFNMANLVEGASVAALEFTPMAL